MIPSTDEILALALVAVYLIDSLWLLGRNEAVVVVRPVGIARIDLGSDFQFAGHRPVLLNPLLPYVLGFRASWSLKATEQDAGAVADSIADSLARVAHALRPIGVISTLAAFAGIIGAPWALLTGRPLWFLAFWSACVLLVLTNGVLALLRHQAIGVSRPLIVWYVVVALVCVPFAGMLARTLAQRTRAQISLPDFANRCLHEPHAGAFRTSFLAMLERFRHDAEENSPAAQRLQSLIDELRKAGP